MPVLEVKTFIAGGETAVVEPLLDELEPPLELELEDVVLTPEMVF